MNRDDEFEEQFDEPLDVPLDEPFEEEVDDEVEEQGQVPAAYHQRGDAEAVRLGFGLWVVTVVDGNTHYPIADLVVAAASREAARELVQSNCDKNQVARFVNLFKMVVIIPKHDAFSVSFVSTLASPKFIGEQF
jgi:hypothetical protein